MEMGSWNTQKQWFGGPVQALYLSYYSRGLTAVALQIQIQSMSNFYLLYLEFVSLCVRHSAMALQIQIQIQIK